MTYPYVSLDNPLNFLSGFSTEARPDVIPPNPPRLVTRKVRLTMFGLAGLAAVMVVFNAVLLTAMTVGSGNQEPMSDVDKACVSVLSNGGVPDDCSRMYNLDFFP